ncbi:MAG: GtrA family protein [Acidobacteria bacterium]|nr:GtrA family protein [Acidobacteriota bacterium]
MHILLHFPELCRRWLVFNFVGIMGIAVQMAILAMLISGFGFAYFPATALAVEAAVLHNFLWHERWTWSDRIAACPRGFFSRLLRFHIANGAVSIAGNLVLMHFLVGKMGLPYLFANAIAIAVCSILNFLAGDRFVFHAVEPLHPKGASKMHDKSNRMAAGACSIIFAALLAGDLRATAAELQPQTLKAWSNYVGRTEQRIQSELSSQKGFLALDFQDAGESARERHAVLSGEVPVRRMITTTEDSGRIPVPHGMIHHWRGSVFIPEVTLDFVFSRVCNPGPEDTSQEDVMESRILGKYPGELKLFLKLQRSQIVTVIYNTEHVVRYRRHAAGLASSSSVATKIVEMEHDNQNKEREKPPGHDRGFLWRMNSYWRYQQVPGGVIVECESTTLSRSIPALLEYMIRPIINKVARESMARTLQAMRGRIIRSHQLLAGISGSQ